MRNQTSDISIKNNFLDSIMLKIDEFDSLVQNLKCNFHDIEEKKSRLFEDDLMNLELEKTKSMRKLKILR